MSHYERLLPRSGHYSRLCLETENNNTLWTRLLKIEQMKSAAMAEGGLGIRCLGYSAQLECNSLQASGSCSVHLLLESVLYAI